MPIVIRVADASSLIHFYSRSLGATCCAGGATEAYVGVCGVLLVQ